MRHQDNRNLRIIAWHVKFWSVLGMIGLAFWVLSMFVLALGFASL